MTQVQGVSWLIAQVGQHLDYDQQYGMQCFDFFNYYYQAISGDNPYTDGFGVSGAKDIWNVATSFFTKIPNSSTLVPQSGDVLIYGPPWGYDPKSGIYFGHVEVCLSSDTNGAWMIGENEHNNPQEGVVKVYRTWAQMNGLIGALRPKFNEGVTMAGIPDQDNWFWRFNKLMLQVRGRNMDRTEFQKNFVGVDPFHMVEIVSDDPEADAATNAQTVGQQAVSEGWQAKIESLNAANQKLVDQLQALKVTPAVLPDAELVAQVKENNSLLSQLLAKLGSIFK